MTSPRGVAVPLVALLVGASWGCATGETARPPVPAGARPSTSPASTTTTAPAAAVRLKVPAVTRDEVARTVFSDIDDQSSIDSRNHQPPRRGTAYLIELACTATVPNKTMTFDVVTAKMNGGSRSVADGSVPCDGTVTRQDLATLPAESLLINLDEYAGREGISAAYAVIRPRS